MPQLGDPVLNLLQAGVVEEHVATDVTVDMPAMGMPLKCYNFVSDALRSRFCMEYIGYVVSNLLLIILQILKKGQ